jgi:hypothetical protein
VPKKPIVVIIRGPIGAGKTTLMRGLARGRRYRFWPLDTDAATSFHPSDPHGEHLDTEWEPEIDILALHAKIVLGRGLNLVLDPGLFLTAANVDRFLRRVGRSRHERSVVLLRLVVGVDEAIRRKTTVGPFYMRASHKGWQPRAVPGEFRIDTNGRSTAWVLREALRAVRARVGPAGRRPA